MADFKTKYTNLLTNNAEIFEKTAEYIKDIEVKLSNSEARVATLTKEASEVERSDSLEKLATAGFSDSEIEELSSVNKDTLEKIASGSDLPVVGMGSASLRPASGNDPLTDFLMS